MSRMEDYDNDYEDDCGPDCLNCGGGNSGQVADIGGGFLRIDERDDENLNGSGIGEGNKGTEGGGIGEWLWTLLGAKGWGKAGAVRQRGG